jgi:hypothetical protein
VGPRRYERSGQGGRTSHERAPQDKPKAKRMAKYERGREFYERGVRLEEEGQATCEGRHTSKDGAWAMGEVKDRLGGAHLS